MVGIQPDDGLYEAVASPGSVRANLAKGDKLRTLHRQLVHCSHDVRKASFPHVIGRIQALNNTESQKCKPCILGKLTRVPKKLREFEKNGVVRRVELVYSDVVVPIKTPFLSRSRYLGSTR